MLDQITTHTAAPDLTSRAMLVTLSIRQWTGRKFDKRVTDEVNASHGAGRDAGRYNKVLIARDALAEITKIQNAARADHAKWSLPWLQDGTRIMPADAFARYSAAMQGHRESFETAVASFVASYPQYVDDARARLNGMFNESDYPSPSQIAKRFAWDVNVLPMPSADDFRVDLGAEHVDRIKADMRQAMQTAIDDAMGDAWSRLHRVVSAMAEKLAAYRPKTDTERAQGIFHATLVGNVRDLVDVLPALNLTGDARLADMIERTRAKLITFDADQLKEDDNARAQVQEAAQAIADDMASFMGC